MPDALRRIRRHRSGRQINQLKKEGGKRGSNRGFSRARDMSARNEAFAPKTSVRPPFWSAEYAAVGFVVEADQDGFAYLRCGCAEVSGRAQHRGDGFIRARLREFELADLFAFGDHQF